MRRQVTAGEVEAFSGVCPHLGPEEGGRQGIIHHWPGPSLNDPEARALVCAAISLPPVVGKLEYISSLPGSSVGSLHLVIFKVNLTNRCTYLLCMSYRPSFVWTR